MFGSSTTEGYGASKPAVTGYAPVMRAALLGVFGGVALRNRGVSGEAIDDMEGRIGDVIADAPDLVVWQAGSNDAPRGIPVARFERIMADGMQRMRSAGADLVLMEPQYSAALEACPGFPPFLASVRSLGARFEVPVFPRYTAMQAWSVETGLGIDGLSPDGTHMTDVGYRLLGEAMAAFILERSGPIG